VKWEFFGPGERVIFKMIQRARMEDPSIKQLWVESWDGAIRGRVRLTLDRTE